MNGFCNLSISEWIPKIFNPSPNWKDLHRCMLFSRCFVYNMNRSDVLSHSLIQCFGNNSFGTSHGFQFLSKSQGDDYEYLDDNQDIDLLNSKNMHHHQYFHSSSIMANLSIISLCNLQINNGGTSHLSGAVMFDPLRMSIKYCIVSN